MWGGGEWGKNGGGKLVFSCPDPHRKCEFKQLHRTVASTDMTHSNRGSSTVQPKVHKVCILGGGKKGFYTTTAAERG